MEEDVLEIDSSSLSQENFFENQEMSVDGAWESQKYDYVLSLLKNDSDFPENFNLEVLNEEDVIQRDLKIFAQERNQLHEWIKSDEIKKVKDFTSKTKSKNYLNDKNYSAAFTAIRNKKFKIYAYLQSINVNLMDCESKEMNKLSPMEKHELRDVMLSFFSASEKSHIYFLISKMKIKSENSFEQYEEGLFGYLEELNQIEDVSIILKVIQYAENLDLVLDLQNENVTTVCPSSSCKTERGTTFHLLKTIYIAAGKRKRREVLGTIAHELTHMAMQLIFKNDCDPYFRADDNGRREFEELAEYLERSVRQVPGTPSETITDAFLNYDENLIPSELIARVSHILAQYTGGEEWLLNNAPQLLNFFKQKVVPECEKFIEDHHLSKQKSLNRYMNESEGEILNLKKCHLFFDKISDLQNFLNSANKKILALITEYTWLGVLRALQAMFGAHYAELYDQFLVFKLESLVKNLGDVEYVFNSEATKVLFVECPENIDDDPRSLRAVKRMIQTVNEKQGKRIIFIMKEDNTNLINLLEGLGDCFAKQVDEDFSVCDLNDRSRRKILDRTILFQGREIMLSDLINGDEDLLKCVNAEMIQDLLDNKNIEIGSKPFDTSNLEGAYADVVSEINLQTLIYEIKNSSDIFVISGEKVPNQITEFHKCLNQEFDISLIGEIKNFNFEISNKRRIFLADEKMTDDDFKAFCSFNSKRKIYFLKKVKNFSLLLLKFYNPDFYFKRQLKKFKKIIIKKSLLERRDFDDYPDEFLICRSKNITIQNCTNSSKVKFIDLEKDKKIIDKHFKEICSSPSKCVHHLKLEDDQLIWIKSHGSLGELHQYIDHDLSKEVVKYDDDNDLRSEIMGEKIVIIADDPGMGKSTTLTKLYDVENVFDKNWVIRINLKDHISTIRKLFNDSSLNMHHVTQFMREIDPKINNNFGRKLLKAAVDVNKKLSKTVLLCFDGFDELVDDPDRQKILDLLKFLKVSTTWKIWVTTRPHYKKDLESALLLFSTKFNPIDDSSKKEFVANYIKDRLKLILPKSKFDEIFTEEAALQEGTRLWTYTEAFINKVKSIFKDDLERFIGTPLQLHLLLENSVSCFLQWIQNLTDLDFSYLGNNLVQVYKRFFDKKYDIYYNKRKMLEQDIQTMQKNAFNGWHKKIAEALIQNKKIDSEVVQGKSSLLFLGIIKAEENGKIEFVHFTFREYFFAKFIVQNFKDHTSSEIPESFYEFFLGEILFEEKYQLIRNFLDGIIASREKKELLKLYDRNIRAAIMSLVQRSSNDWGLIVAIEENHKNIFDFLLTLNWTESEYYIVLLHKKKVKKTFNRKILGLVDDKKLTPFHSAVQCKNDHALDRIIEKALKHNVVKELLGRINEKKRTPFHLAVKHKSDYALERIIEIALKYNLDRKLLDNVDFQERTPFHSAVHFINGFALERIIEIAIKYNLDRQILDNVDKSERTPFHSAVQLKNDYALDRIIEIALKYNLDEELLGNVDFQERTPFHSAVIVKNDYALDITIKIALKYDLGRKLLDNVDSSKRTPFHSAVEFKNDYALDKMIEVALKHNLVRALLNKVDDEKWTPFHYAVKFKNDHALDIIIEVALKYNKVRALLDKVEDAKSTPFHSAVLFKNDHALDRIIEIALKYNLDRQLLDNVDKWKSTPFHSAVTFENHFALDRIIEIALKYNLDRQLLGNNDFLNGTPFNSAVKMKNDHALDRIIEIALKYNLDKELLGNVDIGGVTPFHYAVKCKNDYALDIIIKIALKYNLDRELLGDVDHQKTTPFHYAVEFKNDYALDRIIEIAIKYNLVRELLGDIDIWKKTPFHSAVKFKNDYALDRIIEIALKYNLDRELLGNVDNKKRTTFHFALEYENDYALNKMLELVSSYSLEEQYKLLSIKNYYENTTLHLMMTLKTTSYHSLDQYFKIICKFERDTIFKLISTTNKDQETALFLAIRNHNDYALDQILKVISIFNTNQLYNLLQIYNSSREKVYHVTGKLKNDYARTRISQLVYDSGFSKIQQSVLLGNLA